MRLAVLATLLTSFVLILGVAGSTASETAEKLYGMFVAVTSILPSF